MNYKNLHQSYVYEEYFRTRVKTYPGKLYSTDDWRLVWAWNDEEMFDPEAVGRGLAVFQNSPKHVGILIGCASMNGSGVDKWCVLLQTLRVEEFDHVAFAPMITESKKKLEETLPTRREN